jgi:DUF4097 and DUF4098 domain-containing protein YvlB
MKALKWYICATLMVFVLVSGTDAICGSETVTKSFDIGDKGKLIVDVENAGANITIKVWDRSEVAVRAERIREDDLEYLKIEKDGNTVEVVFDPDRGWGRDRGARFYVSVPSGFDLDLGTSGGNIEVDGDIKGTVEASTAGGNVEVGDVDGELNLRTSGGSISAGNAGTDADLRTSGGNIRIGDVKGELDVSTAGGNITMGAVAKDLEAHTAGGEIACLKVGGNAVVETSGGNIELGVVKGTALAKTAGGNIKIDGATGETVARTAGGNISLADIKGFVNATTAGGDISVELDPNNADESNLETAGGDVELYLPASAKVTIEARIKLRDGRWEDDYEIKSDFEAESHERGKRQVKARYVINGGGKVITIETVNGDIDILKR